MGGHPLLLQDHVACLRVVTLHIVVRKLPLRNKRGASVVIRLGRHLGGDAVAAQEGAHLHVDGLLRGSVATVQPVGEDALRHLRHVRQRRLCDVELGHDSLGQLDQHRGVQARQQVVHLRLLRRTQVAPLLGRQHRELEGVERSPWQQRLCCGPPVRYSPRVFAQPGVFIFIVTALLPLLSLRIRSILMCQTPPNRSGQPRPARILAFIIGLVPLGRTAPQLQRSACVRWRSGGPVLRWPASRCRLTHRTANAGQQNPLGGGLPAGSPTTLACIPR